MKHIFFLFCFLLCASFGLAAQGCLETPGTPSGNIVVVTKRAVLSGKPMRSFTAAYDRDSRIALWVAYPLNAGLIGEGSRGDGWHPSNLLPEKDQASLYKGFAYGSGYDRGHQIPSADRLDPEANAQTFTFINATPQEHDFNGGIWAELEKVVRTWAKRSDTLYVVTGCVPGNRTIADNVGNPVIIPDAYWKAVLRRSTDRSGKTRWSAACVLLPHRETRKGTWQENLAFFRENSLSVARMEEILGYPLFPLLGDTVGNALARTVTQTEPIGEPWWWK